MRLGSPAVDVGRGLYPILDGGDIDLAGGGSGGDDGPPRTEALFAFVPVPPLFWRGGREPRGPRRRCCSFDDARDSDARPTLTTVSSATAGDVLRDNRFPERSDGPACPGERTRTFGLLGRLGLFRLLPPQLMGREGRLRTGGEGELRGGVITAARTGSGTATTGAGSGTGGLGIGSGTLSSSGDGSLKLAGLGGVSNSGGGSLKVGRSGRSGSAGVNSGTGFATVSVDDGSATAISANMAAESDEGAGASGAGGGEASRAGGGGTVVSVV